MNEFYAMLNWNFNANLLYLIIWYCLMPWVNYDVALIDVEIMHMSINGNISMNEVLLRKSMNEVDICHEMNYNDTMISLMNLKTIDEMICMYVTCLWHMKVLKLQWSI